MPYERNEPESQRLDRNFGEQLQEVRIAQAGVQILFAFLLTLPFQQRFGGLTGQQRGIYVVTLVAAALSVVLFTAPVAMHRVLFREGAKDFIVSYTSRVIEAGLATLAVAIVGATVLVLDVLLSPGVAFTVGGALTVVIAVLWLAVPLRRERIGRRS